MCSLLAFCDDRACDRVLHKVADKVWLEGLERIFSLSHLRRVVHEIGSLRQGKWEPVNGVDDDTHISI